MKAIPTVRVDRYSAYLGDNAWFTVTHTDGTQTMHYGTRTSVCALFA